MRLLFTSFLLLFSFQLYSQAHSSGTAKISKFFYANGKIYVSVAVLLIIFFGLYIFLFNMDRSISRVKK